MLPDDSNSEVHHCLEYISDTSIYDVDMVVSKKFVQYSFPPVQKVQKIHQESAEL